MTTSVDLDGGLVQGPPWLGFAYFNARPRTGPLFRPRGPEAEMGYEVCYMLRWYPTLGEDFVIVGQLDATSYRDPCS